MLYEQCIWRLKCFLSIQVKKYLVYLFLASWEWFLQTSALQSASTEERLSGDFLLIKSCVYEFFGVDKKWPYETKNRYIGYFMNKIDRKHIVLQVKTKNVIRFPPLEKLLSLKVMKPSKTAVKTADRSYHFKRHCMCWTSWRCHILGSNWWEFNYSYAVFDPRLHYSISHFRAELSCCNTNGIMVSIHLSFWYLSIWGRRN